MTTPDLSLNVGKVGLMSFASKDEQAHGWPVFHVRIEDFKTAYGNPRYLITPVSGSGSQWVSAERVQLVNETETK